MLFHLVSKYYTFKIRQMPMIYKFGNIFVDPLFSGKALIWHSDEQEKMPSFVLFIKHFLKHYQQNMDQSCNPTPMIQDNVTYQQNDRKHNVINSLRNQMLFTNLEKFPKFSDKSKQNPSKWLTDIQEKMDFKTD